MFKFFCFSILILPFLLGCNSTYDVEVSKEEIKLKLNGLDIETFYPEGITTAQGIDKILMDENDNIFLLTNRKVFCFRWKDFKNKNLQNWHDIKLENISDFTITQNHLWLVVDTLVYQLPLREAFSEDHRVQKYNIGKIKETIKKIFVVPFKETHKIWLVTRKSVIYYQGKITESDDMQDISSIHGDSHGKSVWITKKDGLFQLKIENDVITSYKQDIPNSKELNAIYCSFDGMFICAVGNNNRIFISRDSGKSWQRQKNILYGVTRELQTLYVSFDTKNIWVGGQKGTLIGSIDYGKSWPIQIGDRKNIDTHDDINGIIFNKDRLILAGKSNFPHFMLVYHGKRKPLLGQIQNVEVSIWNMGKDIQENEVYFTCVSDGIKEKKYRDTPLPLLQIRAVYSHILNFTPLEKKAFIKLRFFFKETGKFIQEYTLPFQTVTEKKGLDIDSISPQIGKYKDTISLKANDISLVQKIAIGGYDCFNKENNEQRNIKFFEVPKIQKKGTYPIIIYPVDKDAYQYREPFNYTSNFETQISNIEPLLGTEGDIVTIQGENLDFVKQIFLGTKESEIITPLEEKRIKFKIPQTQNGRYKISIITQESNLSFDKLFQYENVFDLVLDVKKIQNRNIAVAFLNVKEQDKEEWQKNRVIWSIDGDGFIVNDNSNLMYQESITKTQSNISTEKSKREFIFGTQTPIKEGVSWCEIVFPEKGKCKITALYKNKVVEKQIIWNNDETEIQNENIKFPSNIYVKINQYVPLSLKTTFTNKKIRLFTNIKNEKQNFVSESVTNQDREAIFKLHSVKMEERQYLIAIAPHIEEITQNIMFAKIDYDQPKLNILVAKKKQTLVGQTIHRIKVENRGTITAKDVFVSWKLADGVESLNGEKNPIYELGDIPSGESKIFSLTVVYIKRGDICNIFRANASNAPSKEIKHCLKVGTLSLDAVVQCPSMAYIGKRVRNSIIIRNTGDFPLTAIKIRAQTSRQYQVIDSSGGKQNANVINWQIDILQPDESRQLDIMTITKSIGKYCVDITVSTNEGLLKRETCCTTWKGFPALLFEVIDTEDPVLVGEFSNYILEVANQGTSADHNIRIEIVIPPEIRAVNVSGATKGNISNNRVLFAPYPVLKPKEKIKYNVRFRGLKVGDARTRAYLMSELLKTPITEEESTHIY